MPHYKGLTVAKILRFARSKGDINSYISDYKYTKEPNREWLWNAINTLIPEEFQQFISQNIKQHRAELIQSQNLSFPAKPEFVSIFKNSQSVSMHKGRSHFLTRESKISKDKSLINKFEEEKQIANKKIDSLECELHKLYEKIEELKEKQEEAIDNEQKLGKLFELGVINDKGEPINNDMNKNYSQNRAIIWEYLVLFAY